MIRSILRAIGIRGWSNQKLDLVDCVSQRVGAGECRSQMPGRNNLTAGFAVASRYDRASNYLDNYHTTLDRVGGSKIEVHERRSGISHDFERWAGGLSGRLNFVGHNTPPSLKARFRRACRAFVNAWNDAAGRSGAVSKPAATHHLGRGDLSKGGKSLMNALARASAELLDALRVLAIVTLAGTVIFSPVILFVCVVLTMIAD